MSILYMFAIKQLSKYLEYRQRKTIFLPIAAPGFHFLPYMQAVS